MTAVSLHGVAWTVIFLLRYLFLGATLNIDALALQLSILIIGLPVYVGHWLWAQRLARGDLDERVCFQRQLFFFIFLIGTLAPVLNNVFQILNQGLILKEKDAFVINIVPIIILTAIFAYHYLIQKESQSALEKEDSYLILRQLFVLGFSFTGLAMLFTGSISILTFIIQEIKGNLSGYMFVNLGSEVIRLALGTITWGVFWSWSQRSYRQLPDEQSSTYRWGYLYIILIITTISTITSIAVILDSLISSWVGIDSDGQGTMVLPTFIMMGIFWFYHAFVLQKSDRPGEIDQRRTNIKWIYHYLVALVGFSSFVVGLTGLLHLFIRFFILDFSGSAIERDLSTYVSMVLAGFPTWLVAWRTISTRINRDEESGERQSSIRKNYLYLIVLASALTIIDALIFILYQLILKLLGTSNGQTLNEIGVFFANLVVAALVLAYHLATLRADGKLTAVKGISELGVVRIVVLGTADDIGGNVLETLKESFPGLHITLINPFEITETPEEQKQAIAHAELLLLPMSLFSQEDLLRNELIQKAFSSNGKKVIIPQHLEGFEWVGVRIYDSNSVGKRTAKIVKKILAGETNISERPMGCLGIGGTIVGIIIILILLTSLVSYFY
jgi:hypothetical protein